MAEQDQFLEVIDRDVAQRRFRAALHLEPLEPQCVAIREALGRVLCREVTAAVDVPSFDRSNFDGFAVRAADTHGATEEVPRRLRLLDEIIATAVTPRLEVGMEMAVSIATGGMLPRGADAIVMVEHTDVDSQSLIVRRAVTAGFGVAYAGTDIAAGQTVLRQGQVLTSRETGVLAAIGVDTVAVWRRPLVGIISTGDEIIAPGETMRPGLVYDSNGRIISDAVAELGCEPIELGIVRDDLEQLRQQVHRALGSCDMVLLSGGTSKGVGDMSYRVVRELNDPGIVAHGVALKPGKPICLAASGGKPVVVLPGFPTSAIFTFHEFVAPVLRRLAGRKAEDRATLRARMAVKVNSEIGRTEYLLVGLMPPAPGGTDQSLVAYPMGKGSGSVTTFSHADGFVSIDRHHEIVEAKAPVEVQLLGRDLKVADLIVIGSHCVGLDYLLGRLQELGLTTKFLAVGSTGGLEAARRGECDLAGIHLLDPESGQYNHSFLSPDLELIMGYGRMQGLVVRAGDGRFGDLGPEEVIALAKTDPHCMMVNRNRGSGTRMLIDRLLGGSTPQGYAVQSRNHNAVAAAVIQGRADWGIAIEAVARSSQLRFLPLTQEHYDFVAPRSRAAGPAVSAFRRLLTDTQVQSELAGMGLLVSATSEK